MKILIVSIYDYMWEKSAGIIEDGKFSRIDLTDDEYAAIHEYPWYDDHKDVYNNLLKRYDMIIRCEDGGCENLSNFVAEPEDTKDTNISIEDYYNDKCSYDELTDMFNKVDN